MRYSKVILRLTARIVVRLVINFVPLHFIYECMALPSALRLPEWRDDLRIIPPVTFDLEQERLLLLKIPLTSIHLHLPTVPRTPYRFANVVFILMFSF
jgi:hypothetical protein